MSTDINAAGPGAGAPRDAADAGVDALLASVVEQAGVAILAVDARGAFRVFNATAERYFGVTRDRVATLDDVRHLAARAPDGAAIPPEHAPLARALRGEALRDVQLVATGADGAQRVLAGVATPLRGADGAPAGAALYLRDVSERDRLEVERVRALRAAEESERRHRLLAHNFPGAVLLYDRDLRIVLADGPVLDRLGLAREGLEGKTIAEVVPPDRRAIVEPAYRAALAGETVTREIVAGDVVMSAQHHPVRDATGAIVGGLVLALDVTESRRADDALRVAHQRMSRILASPMMGVVVSDYDGRILEANDAYLRMVGFTREDLAQGRLDWRALTPPEWREASARAVAALQTTGFVPPFEKEYFRKDGSRVATLVGSTRLPDEQRNLTIVLDVSERKRMEVTLRQQAHLLETIMQNASLGLVMMDARQRCTYMNPAAERVFGYALDEVRAADKPLHDIVHHSHPDGRPYPMEDCPIDRALPTRMRERGEDVFVRRDGTFYPVAFTASPILEGGTPVGTVIEVRDTTEERRIAARLREQAETLEVLNEVGLRLQGELELDALVQAVTDAATKLAGAQFGSFFYNVVDAKGEGYTLYTISGVPREAFSRFPMPRNTAVFAPTFAGQGVVRVANIREDPRYGKNAPYHGMPEGHLPVTSYLAVPVVSRTGKVIGGLFFGHEKPGVFTEQSERLVTGLAAQAAIAMDNAALYRSERRAAEAAEFERARLRKLLAQLPAGVAVSWGPDHRFDWANEIYARVVGRDVAGKPVREAFPELAGQPFFDMLDGVYASGVPVHGKEMLVLLDRRRDGTIEQTYFDFVYQPIFDPEGRVEGILTFCIEVTTSVTARHRVESLAADLSRAVADERRAVAERERLIQQLEKTNRDLDQFAYVASHDLKAPLRGIANLSQWIEEDLEAVMTPEARKQMALLRGRVQRLEALIDGVLQYSRAGRVTAPPEPVDTRKLCSDVWDMLAPPPAARLALVEPLPELVTERVPLQQVIQNLIANAIKHGGDAPTVTISAADRGDAYEFAVADDGPGIAPEFHERIWGIFQTLAARDRVEGTGIGLSVVRKLVENHGGRAWVESDVGRGATFRFTWPKRTAAA